ncbi:MAG: Crp/Fnr family transcriptional regulator, partial [Thermoanaerobaculia bacterium]
MTAVLQGPKEQSTLANLLLSQLSVHERNAIHRGAETLILNPGDILLRAHTHSEFVFFPINAVASVVRTLRDGKSCELALIGNEGMVGLDVFMDAKTQLDDFVVLSGGWAYKLPADELRRQYRRNGTLQKYLLRFTDALLAQVAQSAICGRYHSPQARLARWLLMIRDRTASAEIRVTQPAIRTMLAVDPDRATDCVERL